MENKYVIVALVGPSGSGKDTLLNQVLYSLKEDGKSVNKIIATTIRPKRDYEKDGVDYYFTDRDTFETQLMEGKIIEAACFNEWYYGTSIDALSKDKINIGIFSPMGLSMIQECKDVIVIPVFVRASDKERLIRQLSREDHPDIKEIFRRYEADAIDFLDLDLDTWITVENDSIFDLYASTSTLVQKIPLWAKDFNLTI